MKDGEFEPIRQYLCAFSQVPEYQKAIHACFRARLDERASTIKSQMIEQMDEYLATKKKEIEYELNIQREITSDMKKDALLIGQKAWRSIIKTIEKDLRRPACLPSIVFTSLDSILSAENKNEPPVNKDYMLAMMELDEEFPGAETWTHCGYY